MLQALTVAALLLPPQTTLDVCHVCKKKITERVSDKTHAYLPYKFQFCSNLCHYPVTNVKLIYHSLPRIPT